MWDLPCLSAVPRGTGVLWGSCPPSPTFSRWDFGCLRTRFFRDSPSRWNRCSVHLYSLILMGFSVSFGEIMFAIYLRFPDLFDAKLYAYPDFYFSFLSPLNVTSFHIFFFLPDWLFLVERRELYCLVNCRIYVHIPRRERKDKLHGDVWVMTFNLQGSRC